MTRFSDQMAQKTTTFCSPLMTTVSGYWIYMCEDSWIRYGPRVPVGGDWLTHVHLEVVKEICLLAPHATENFGHLSPVHSRLLRLCCDLRSLFMPASGFTWMTNENTRGKRKSCRRLWSSCRRNVAQPKRFAGEVIQALLQKSKLKNRIEFGFHCDNTSSDRCHRRS